MGKKNVNAKKTEVDGILFASKIESEVYQILKKEGFDFEYEKTTYKLFEDFTFNFPLYELWGKNMIDREGKTFKGTEYTPDFEINLNGIKVIIEVKGRKNESFPIRWLLFKKMLVEKNEPVMLFMPNNKKAIKEMINIIKEKRDAFKEKDSNTRGVSEPPEVYRETS